MMKKITALFVLVCFLSRGWAQEYISTDRPDESETPYVLAEKMLQVEWGIKKTTLADNLAAWVLPDLQLRYGLSKKTEILLLAQYSNTRSGSRFTDSTSALKISPAIRYNLIKGKGIIPHTSLLLASGFNKFSSGKVIKPAVFSPELRLAMSNTVSEKLSIGYNLGAEWEDMDEQPEWAYTFTPEFEFSERWGGYIEIFGFVKSGENESSIDMGIQYKLNKNFAFDAFAGRALSNEHIGFFAGIGAAFRFKTGK